MSGAGEGRRDESQVKRELPFFYSRVYDSERPELSLKRPGWRVVAPYGKIRVRRRRALECALNQELGTGYYIGTPKSSVIPW